MSHRWFFLALASTAFLAACGEDPVSNSNQSEEKPAPAPTEKIEGMVWIPAGKFLMGSYSGMPNEQPVHEVELDGFYMDEAEVTNAQYREFVKATGYVTLAERPMTEAQLAMVPPEARGDGPIPFGSIIFRKTEGPVPLQNMNAWWAMEFFASWKQPHGKESNIEGMDDHPVVCVAYEDALAYAKWAKKRLPTEAEWEYAARGGLIGKKYEWGNAPLPGEKSSKPEDWPCNIWQGNFPYEDWGTDGFAGTSPAKSYKPNGFGLYDMTGNVWELCEDWFGANYYRTSPPKNPTGPPSPEGARTGENVRTMRGSSWRIHKSYGPTPPGSQKPIVEYRPATRNEAAMDTATNDVGFRCVRDRE